MTGISSYQSVTHFFRMFLNYNCLLLAGSVALACVAPLALKANEVKDLMTKYCVDCHGQKKAKAKLTLHDLSVDDLGGDNLERWEKCLEMISLGDMPPEDKPQPSAEEREKLIKWMTSHLKKAGLGRSAGQFDLPKYGNRLDHEKLFSGEHKGPAYTESRLWRISPEIYQRFSSKIDMARKFNAPLQTAGTEGFGDYSYLYADEATILTMLQNCKRAATTILEGRIKSGRNRSSTVETKQGGREGSRHRVYKEFLEGEGEVSREEMEEVLAFTLKFLLDRKVRPEDLERYLEGFFEPNLKESGRYHALRGLLTIVMMSPEFLFRMELGLGEELPDGRRMLAPREMAYALSFALFDYVDPKLLSAADEGRLKTKEDVAREVRRMMSEPDRSVRGPVGNHLWVMGKGAGIVFAKHKDASYPRLLRFWREFFGYTKAADVFKDDQRAGEHLHNPFKRIGDADWFVLKILKDDREVFSRLLTDDLYYVEHRVKKKGPKGSGPSEKVYNLEEGAPWPEKAPGDYRQTFYKMPDGQRAGMLTHPAWLAAHSGNFENDPVRRGKWVREHLLAGAVPDLPIGVEAQLPEEPHRTLRQRFDVVKKEECWRCHKKMNPLGYPFEKYDDFGRYRDHHLVGEDGKVVASYFEAFSRIRQIKWRDSHPRNHPPEKFTKIPVDAKGAIDGTGEEGIDGEVNSAFELSHRLAKSVRVRQSIIRHMFRFWMGRNETLSDSPTLMAMDKAYVESSGSFRETLVALLTSDSFLYRKTL
ncbi:MAG: DUF1588 domain-containing protein [Akkermansiaceae bacterium]